MKITYIRKQLTLLSLHEKTQAYDFKHAGLLMFSVIFLTLCGKKQMIICRWKIVTKRTTEICTVARLS
jgi:hypothetical protein